VLTERVTAAASAHITAITGTLQSAAVNSRFAVPLQLGVTDAYGNPLAGVMVTFGEMMTNGAGGTFAGGLTMFSIVTDANGIARRRPSTRLFTSSVTKP
jgi:hypothetical protein